MTSGKHGFQHILVATDFSPHAEAALQQALWIARQVHASITLIHCLPDLRRVVLSASSQGKLDLLAGEGEKFHREVRQKSDAKMRQMIARLHASDLKVDYETVLGEPFREIIHAVQQEGYDLVLVGTRGLGPWERFFVGSTAKRLIRKCPTAVWIAKAEHVGPPKVVLAATDCSDVSLRAAAEGWWVAQQAQAAFHLLHVIDSSDVPEDLVSHIPQGSTMRQEINDAAMQRLNEFVGQLGIDPQHLTLHLSWGTPWKEIQRLAQHLATDLLAIGTVGRSGVKGMLLGNTAEQLLSTCDCSMLTVKPEGFVSPIEPASWTLHPGPPRTTS